MPDVSDCPEPTAFSAFVSGALSGAARAALELHVDTCEPCRITLSESVRGSARGSSPASEAVLPAVGDQVDRYTITGKLGAGAMGVVYAAHDPELGRDLAIKLVQPQVGLAEDELVHQRMLREGRALARIDHPNVVRVFDVGRWRGAFFVAMERVSGSSLRAWLEAEPRSTSAIVDVFAQCAVGLAAAHAARVIHRDFKPDNAIVDATGRARVTDFGLALTELDALPEHAPVATTAAIATSTPKLTRTHGAVGTPAYMAPEQHRGGAIDERVDQFALCVALAEALGKDRPFAAASIDAIAAGPRLAASIPRRVRRALERGLAFDPEQRFPSMTALARALNPPRSRRRFVVAALVTSALAAGSIMFAMRDHDVCDAVAEPITARWNPARDRRVATIFEHAGRSFAAPAWSYARAAIDRYVARWSALRVDTCRSGDPLARAATERCLDRRAAELDAVLERWEHGDPVALATAPQAVDALVPVERCITPELDPIPGDLFQTTRLAGFEHRFTAANAEFLAGRITDAAARLAVLEHELAATPFRTLHAEVLLELSGIETDLGRTAPARAHLIAAIAAAETAGAARIKARAWIELAALAGDDGVRLAEAHDALRLSAAVIEHLGNPVDLVERREVSAGLLALRDGDHARAVSSLRASLGRQPLTPTERVRRLQILARTLIAGGEIAAGLAELERARGILTEAFGPETPQLVYVLNSMIEPLDYLGRREEAIARGDRALALFDAGFGRDNPRRTSILNNLAHVHGNLGNHARARELSEQVLRDDQRHHGPDHYQVGVAHNNLASDLIEIGAASDAVPHLERALAIFGKTIGADHPTVANVHASFAHANTLLGQHAEALRHARRALAIREAALVGPGYLAYTRLLVAETLLAAGKRDEAIAMARQAAALPLASTGREGELAKSLREWLARNARR